MTPPFAASASRPYSDAVAALPAGELFVPAPLRGPARRLWSARTTWFGLGLSGRRVSAGLPVDVLVLLLAQEQLRRRLRHPTSTILLADSNAIGAGHSVAEVEAAAARTQATLRGIAAQLRLPLRFVRGSELIDPEAIEQVRRRWDQPPAYIAHQLAQMQVMARRGASVKLGWSMSGSFRDEASFDRGYRRIDDPSLAFVYTICGRALDRDRPRACPYLCEDPATRIMLEPGEDIEAKLAATDEGTWPAARGYRRFLGKLGRATARLMGRRSPRDPLGLLQGLVDGLAPANDCAAAPGS